MNNEKTLRDEIQRLEDSFSDEMTPQQCNSVMQRIYDKKKQLREMEKQP